MSQFRRSQVPLSTPGRPIYHSAASKRLSQALEASASPPPSATSSVRSSPTSSTRSHVYPTGDFGVLGTRFDVDFDHVFSRDGKLSASRLGYRVKHKSKLSGGRDAAPIWRYGVELEYAESDGSLTKLWLCKLCHLKRERNDARKVNGIRHITEHMRVAHRIDPALGLLPETPQKPAFSSPFEAARAPGSNTVLSHSPWQEEALQAALVDWVIIQDVSFSNATAPSTRGLLTWNRTSLLSALPNSHTTIASYVTASLKRRIVEVAELLQSSASKISVSVDVWTSSNYLSFLGVVAHFVDANFQQQDVLIALRNLYSDHTGAAQALIITSVLDFFKIAPKLHCFIGDNATSNDSELIKGLNRHADISLEQHHRLRCAGHLINLVIKATIYGKGVSGWEEQLAAAAPMEQFELFRKLGVVGKLHNFVNAVCASHERRELFNLMQTEANNDESIYSFNTLSLRQDGGVRWHSVYLMMLRCLELKEPIKRFIRKLSRATSSTDFDNDDTAEPLDYSPLTDGLSDDEWEEAKELVDFLQAPYEMTKRLEGNNSSSGFGSLWQTLTIIQALWAAYTEAIDRPHNSQYFETAVRLGLEKINTYYERLLMEPDVSIYAVATALHPHLRLLWFKTHWKNFPHRYGKAEKSIRRMYRQYLEASAAPEEAPPPPSRRKIPLNSNDLYSQTMAVDLHLLTNAKSKRQKRTTQLDEYFDDLLSDVTNASKRELELLDDPWAWWLQIGRDKYPVVFKMATDYLSIPSTSCDFERAFSKARRTITCDRNSLSSTTIEALQLQKNWLARGVVKSSLTELQKHVQSVDKKRSNSGADSLLGDSASSADQSESFYSQ